MQIGLIWSAISCRMHPAARLASAWPALAAAFPGLSRIPSGAAWRHHAHVGSACFGGLGPARGWSANGSGRCQGKTSNGSWPRCARERTASPSEAPGTGTGTSGLPTAALSSAVIPVWTAVTCSSSARIWSEAAIFLRSGRGRLQRRRRVIRRHLRADLAWCGHGLRCGRRAGEAPAPAVVVSRLSGPLPAPARVEERG
jgi:hypothetical protein